MNSGDNEAAARLFAPGARVIQAGRVYTLADRTTSRCDAPGVEVTAVFEIRDGKIVVWEQLPGTGGPPPGQEV